MLRLGTFPPKLEERDCPTEEDTSILLPKLGHIPLHGVQTTCRNVSLALVVTLGATFTLAAVLINIGGAPLPVATLNKVVEAQQVVPGGSCQDAEEDVEFHTPEHQTLQVLSGLTDPGSCCTACKAHPECNVWMYASPEASTWDGMANVEGHCFFKRLNAGDQLIRIHRRGFTGAATTTNLLKHVVNPMRDDRPEAKVKPMRDDRPEAKFKPMRDDRPDAKVKPVRGLRPDAKVKPMKDDKLDAKIKPMRDDRPDAKVKPMRDDRPDAKVKPMRDGRPEAKVKPLRDDRPEAKVKFGLPVHREQLPKSRKDSRSPVEVSEAKSVWEVVAPFAPVMLKPGAGVIGHKPHGQILVGSHVGSMVKLTHDFGFAPINKPDGGNYLQERTLTYRIVHKGTCANAGFTPIRDPTVCTAAAFAFGYFDRHVTQYTGNLHRPEGCYLHGGTVWVTKPETNKGRGAMAQSFPICSRLAPTTSTVVFDSISARRVGD